LLRALRAPELAIDDPLVGGVRPPRLHVRLVLGLVVAGRRRFLDGRRRGRGRVVDPDLRHALDRYPVVLDLQRVGQVAHVERAHALHLLQVAEQQRGAVDALRADPERQVDVRRVVAVLAREVRGRVRGRDPQPDLARGERARALAGRERNEERQCAMRHDS
jgi:hypothetical protein